MIGYTSIGTNNLTKAVEFYDILLTHFGAQRAFEHQDFIAWSAGENQPSFSVHLPYDGKPATIGNGVMIAFTTQSKEMVDAVYHHAIELGGTDEGAPGFRMEGFYAAYFRDLDGNKINIHCMSA